MKPIDVDRAQQPRTFTSILRHVARHPLLLVWLTTLAAGTVAFQSKVPQPWSALIYLVIIPVGMISITRSLGRAHPHREDSSNN